MCILAPELLLALAIDHKLWVDEGMKRLIVKGLDADMESQLNPCNWPGLMCRYFGCKIPGDNDNLWKPKNWLGLLCKKLGREIPDDEHKLTATHVYYGNMGGFIMYSDTNVIDLEKEQKELSEAHKRGRPVTMDELLTCLHDDLNWSDAGSLRNANLNEEKRAERTKQILEKMGMTRADIDDRDKGSLFARIITVLQIFWLCFSLCTRLARKLGTSQLEIVTFAFAVCAFITYCINWNKPQNIRIARNVYVKVGPNYNKIVEGKHPLRFWNIFRGHLGPISKRKLRLRNDIIRPIQKFPSDMLTLLAVEMAGVGAVHVIAWNFSFPTRAESYLWRIASLIATCVPILLLVFAYPLPFMISWVRHGYYEYTPRGQKKVRNEAQAFAKLCMGVMEDYIFDIENDSFEMEKNASFDMERIASYVSRAREELRKASRTLRDKSDPELTYEQIFIPRLADIESTNTSTIERINSEKDDSKELLMKLNDYIQDSRDEGIEKNFRKQFGRLASKIANPRDPKEPSHVWEAWLKDKKAHQIQIFPFRTRRQFAKDTRQRLLRRYSPMIAILYTAARFLIIALAFSSLRAMPDSVYQTTWTRYIPLIQ